MSRKTSVFALIVLTLALILIPSVHAEYPIDNVVVVQDLPENMVAGNSYEMSITFDNVAEESVFFVIKITVTSEPPIGEGEIFIDEIKLNGVDLIELSIDVFTTVEGSVSFSSHNELNITISTAINLMPGDYLFEVALLGEELPNKPPVADADGPYSGYRGRTINFNGMRSYDLDGEIVSYAWDFGDDKTGTGSTPSHIYDKTGTYTAILTVTDDEGATDSDTATVKVSKLAPTPPVNKDPHAKAGPNQKAWVGHTVYFDGSKSTDPDGYIVSYEWDLGDGTTPEGVTLEHAYSEPGDYEVILTVRDPRGGEDSDTCKVKISEPPADVSAEFAERVRTRALHVVDAMEEANTTVTLETTDNVTVTVLRYEENPYPRDPIPAMALPTYVDVEVSDPDAVIWPIYVEMYYTDEEVMGLDESTFGIYYWFNGTWQRCSHTGVDTELNIVWAYMTAEEAAGSPILIAGMHAITPPPLPPFFYNLIITPEELELGDNVTISIDIMNTGSQPLTYGVDMEIGELTLRIWVDLEAYESKTVSHTITMDTVGTYNVNVMRETGSFTVKAPPKPAEFVVSDLSITPEEFELGEGVDVWSFRITVDVENVGEQEGTHTVDLKIDGEVVESGTVILWGGEETMIVFDVTRGVGVHTVEVEGLTGSFTVTAHPKPAEFVVSDLYASPEVEEGEDITLSVKITNIGETEGSYTVEFKVDGEMIETETVTLAGGDSTTVSFEETWDPGTYQINVEDLTKTFTVSEKPPVQISPGYAAGILILIASAGAVIYYIWKGKLFSTFTSGSHSWRRARIGAEDV